MAANTAKIDYIPPTTNHLRRRHEELSAEEIAAADPGAPKTKLYITTLERYIDLVNMLRDLKAQIDAADLVTIKEYIKGRENEYINPAIKAYNQTCESANKTALLLLKMREQAAQAPDDPADDPLYRIMHMKD